MYPVHRRFVSRGSILFLFWVISFCSACHSDELRKDATLQFVSSDDTVSEVFHVQVAKTPDETRRGLMRRRSMPQNQGMLFVFEGMSERSFWMKNTYISLDMIFIDAEGKVVHIIPNVPPLSHTSRKSIYPCTYVLELNGGRAKSGGVVVGSVMKVSPESVLSRSK